MSADRLNVIFGVLGLILGVLGVVIPIVTSRLVRRFRSRHRPFYDWEAVSSGSRELARKCIRQFGPDAILTLSGPGAVLASLAMVESGRFLPLYTVIQIEKEKNGSSDPNHDIPMYSIRDETGKWDLYFPDALCAIPDKKKKKITVLDDCALTGDLLSKVRARLTQLGFEDKNILTAVLVCSQVAIRQNKAPNFYVHSERASEFELPWGVC